MSNLNQARVEFGTAGSNIAGNIEVLLPQLAARGAEVAKAANQIHEILVKLRHVSREFTNSTEDVIKPVEFDKFAEQIEVLLPQFSGHGAEVDAVANAINGYCKQLETVHAQHLHLTDESAPVVPGLPLVNNGIGSGPFETGTAVAYKNPSVEGIDPNPNPVGDGKEKHPVSTDPGKAELA